MTDTATEPRTEIRCPYCGSLEFVALTDASGVLETKCRRPRCGKLFTVDLADVKPCNGKVIVLTSD